MKKIIAMLLAVMLVASMAACGNNAAEATVATTEATTPATESTAADNTAEDVVPASALEVLETVWNSYADDDKFAVFGGNQNENAVMDAPGAFDVADTEGLTYLLLVPEDQIANIDGAASMVHLMNGNNFTCGVFHVTGDVQAFAAAMKAAINGNRWMCGMPEQMFITVIGGEYVLVSYGVGDAMNPFQAKVAAAYPGAKQFCAEALA